jgi:DNA polymerase III subunit chi
MTEIDFYILDASNPDSSLIFACRLAEKAVDVGRNVLIRPPTRGDARRLDELLWTYTQGSFLPHRLVSDAAAEPIEPVLIDDGPGPSGNRWDLLINLAADVPDYFSRYVRVAEVVDGQRREDGRERYRYYRDRGYPLKTHQIRA